MTIDIDTPKPTCVDVGEGLELWAHAGDVWVQLEDDKHTNASLMAAYFEDELTDSRGGAVALSREQIEQVNAWDDEVDQ